jgi:hypothetical protein
VGRWRNVIRLYLLILHSTEFRNMKHELDEVHVTLNGRVVHYLAEVATEPTTDAEQSQKGEKYMSVSKIRILHHLTTPPTGFTRIAPVTGCLRLRVGTIG